MFVKTPTLNKTFILKFCDLKDSNDIYPFTRIIHAKYNYIPLLVL